MKRLSQIILLVILVLFATFGLSVKRYSWTYMDRIIRLGESDVWDYKVFPSRLIEASDYPVVYPHDPIPEFGQIKVDPEEVLESLLAKTHTQSFLVIHNDQLVYEYYGKGYDEAAINTSFSAAKSMVSLMIGIAIDKGLIKSEDEPLSVYIEELRGSEIGNVTIKQLLTMRSPIVYKEGPLWFGDDAKTYYMPDLRTLALQETTFDPQYTGAFHYNNYHPLLLGVIIERSTGRSVSAFFVEELWGKIGSEYSASWSLDSEQTGFEKMESGLNFRAIDFAKVGSVVLHNGFWNGKRIVSEEWIEKSTQAEFPLNDEAYTGTLLEGKQTGYQYMWYSCLNDENGIDVFAAGKYGQYLYISPLNNTVIVRTGSETGLAHWWPDILKAVAKQF